MTELRTIDVASDFVRTTTLTPMPGLPDEFSVELDPGWSWVAPSVGGLAVEHGVIAAPDGALVAESFQTRLTATG